MVLFYGLVGLFVVVFYYLFKMINVFLFRLCWFLCLFVGVGGVKCFECGWRYGVFDDYGYWF